jgi:hypothetical protein
MPKRRRNDAPWRNECIEVYGDVCRSCGDTGNCQMDHLKPRSQGGPSVVENGLPLCGPASRVTPGGCHALKTERRMLVEPEWLTDDQIQWLSDVGWVTWDTDGQPYGRGWRNFAPRRVPVQASKGGA